MSDDDFVKHLPGGQAIPIRIDARLPRGLAVISGADGTFVAANLDTGKLVVGQARRDISCGEEKVRIVFDIVTEIEEGADVGPVLADEPKPS